MLFKHTFLWKIVLLFLGSQEAVHWALDTLRVQLLDPTPSILIFFNNKTVTAIYNVNKKQVVKICNTVRL